ncbi:uncharacterized protein [Drosophila kikkawai]|uniref:Uncharacterized protein isoform X4 n=1 Tax=Drosophila kikkawai TaxID=30033 RepID=A0ABM4GDA4_DROKI
MEIIGKFTNKTHCLAKGPTANPRDGTYDTSHSIFLAGLVLSIIAAFCLIFAAALNMVIPVWVWLVIILPSTLLVVIGHCLILRGYWDYETDLTKATDVIFLIVYICMVVVTVYNSLLFLGSLNKEDT